MSLYSLALHNGFRIIHIFQLIEHFLLDVEDQRTKPQNNRNQHCF